MADTKISALTAAGALSGSESVPVVQSGTTKKTTAQDIANLIPVLSINTQTDSYTLVLGDAGKLIEMNKASANDLTVPPNSSVAFAIGTSLLIANLGAGQTSVVAGSGVTILSASGALKLASQYSMATLVKRATNTWYLSGDIEM